MPGSTTPETCATCTAILRGLARKYPEEVCLAPVFELQRKAQWRLDFVNAENSMGFHAPQEAARILGEAIDQARQGQIALRDLRL